MSTANETSSPLKVILIACAILAAAGYHLWLTTPLLWNDLRGGDWRSAPELVVEKASCTQYAYLVAICDIDYRDPAQAEKSSLTYAGFFWWGDKPTLLMRSRTTGTVSWAYGIDRPISRILTALFFALTGVGILLGAASEFSGQGAAGAAAPLPGAPPPRGVAPAEAVVARTQRMQSGQAGFGRRGR